MGKREVVFGEKEKHTLEISWSNWTGVATITIDGQWKNDVSWGDTLSFAMGHQSYDYIVGTNEIHSVHVEIGYGVNSPSTIVVVDRKIVE